MKKTKQLSNDIKRKAWSMLNNLSGEAEYFKDEKGRLNNTDEAIAIHLGASITRVRQYLHDRVERHLNRINNRINKIQ